MGISGGFAAMGIMSGANAYASANAQKAQAQFTAGQYSANAKIAGEQGTEAKAAGDIQSGQMALQTKVNVASQRVASAATGADVNSGSALELQEDTKWQGAQNEVTIKNNAWRQAWGYGVQSSDYSSQAQFATLAGNNQYNTTLLTGGMNALNYGIQGGSAYMKYHGDNTEDLD